MGFISWRGFGGKKPLRSIFALRRFDVGIYFLAGFLVQKIASLNFCTPEVWCGDLFFGGDFLQQAENTPLRPLREVFCGDEKLITQLKQGSRAHAAADAHGFHTVFHAFVLHIGEQGGTEF